MLRLLNLHLKKESSEIGKKEKEIRTSFAVAPHAANGVIGAKLR
jgi:hypothetical protein